MLTVTLRGLERDGILTRTVHNVMPPHVSYAPTPLGMTLREATAPLLEWSLRNLDDIHAARDAHDSRAETAPPAPSQSACRYRRRCPSAGRALPRRPPSPVPRAVRR